MDTIEYVFYSGGFDTTFYLLECLLVKKVKVQPLVVISNFIDGDGMKRHSEYQESISRKNFYTKFKDKYPDLSDNLLDEIVFKNETILDKETLKIGIIGYNKGIFSRTINQLLYFHQVCKDNNIKNAAIGYQKDDYPNGFNKYFFTNELNLQVPLFEKTKEDLLNFAKKYKYDEFLYETWSCWYPLPGNKPCGKCALCSITIVDTKLEFPKNKKFI